VINIPVALTGKTVVIKKCAFAFVEVPNLTFAFQCRNFWMFFLNYSLPGFIYGENPGGRAPLSKKPLYVLIRESLTQQACGIL
jgi:hypothetical protein